MSSTTGRRCSLAVLVISLTALIADDSNEVMHTTPCPLAHLCFKPGAMLHAAHVSPALCSAQCMQHMTGTALHMPCPGALRTRQTSWQ